MSQTDSGILPPWKAALEIRNGNLPEMTLTLKILNDLPSEGPNLRIPEPSCDLSFNELAIVFTESSQQTR